MQFLLSKSYFLLIYRFNFENNINLYSLWKSLCKLDMEDLTAPQTVERFQAVQIHSPNGLHQLLIVASFLTSLIQVIIWQFDRIVEGFLPQVHEALTMHGVNSEYYAIQWSPA